MNKNQVNKNFKKRRNVAIHRYYLFKKEALYICCNVAHRK